MDIDRLSPTEKRALLARLLRQRAGAREIDLAAEACFDLVVDGEPWSAAAGAPRELFLTGATGFVGAFVLRRLLDETRGRVHCLVRAADAEDARRRIAANLASYNLPSADISSRVVAIAGDLTRPSLGLASDRYASLAAGVDAIYHIAALVNLAYDYHQLKPTNVDGTREVIRLAATARVKPIHYLSSYAVFDSVDNVGRIFSERDVPDRHERLSNGYAETKWVAEHLIRGCRVAGIPTAIYRVGWVIGHSRTGAWNRTDFIPRLIKASIDAGRYCDFGTLTMTPVDYVAETLVYLAARDGSLGRTFHVSNGRRYASRQLFAWIRQCGYDLREVPLDEWEEQIRRSSEALSLAPLLLFLEDIAGGMSRLSQWLSNEPDVDVSDTRRELASSGIVSPDIDEKMMAVCLSSFVATGDLRRPDASARPAAESAAGT